MKYLLPFLLLACSKLQTHPNMSYATSDYTVLVGRTSDAAGHWYRYSGPVDGMVKFRTDASDAEIVVVTIADPTKSAEESYQEIRYVAEQTGNNVSDREFCPEIENGTQFVLYNGVVMIRIIMIDIGDDRVVINTASSNEINSQKLISIFLKNFKVGHYAFAN